MLNALKTRQLERTLSLGKNTGQNEKVLSFTLYDIKDKDGKYTTYGRFMKISKPIH